uniref:Uncharacterized protein n=1 Tax=Salix viminalis TaxID=40686 RepID=A0A6N2MVT7_SALVM
MRLKRGQETPFHRLLWWIFLFSFPFKFYHVFFAWFREIKEHSMENSWGLENGLVILVLLSAGSECTEVFLGQNSRRRKAPLVRPQPNLFSIVYVVISAMIHSRFILPCLLR